MELVLSLAQLFIANWWKNVFTLHRYNNNYMFRLLTLAIIRLYFYEISYPAPTTPYHTAHCPRCPFMYNCGQKYNLMMANIKSRNMQLLYLCNVNTFFHQLTINSCARLKISSILIQLFEHNGEAEPYGQVQYLIQHIASQ